MLRTHGVAEYFTGLTPILLRNSLGTALYFAFRSHLATLFESAGSRVRSLINSSLHQRSPDVPFLNVPSAAVPRNADPSLAFNERGSREHSLFSNQSPQLQLKQQQHSRFVNFVSGAAIGALCSTLVYPLNVIKAHMQSRVGVPAAGNFRRTFAELSERGARKSYIWQPFYRGVSLNCSRAIISWGIINMVYEQAKSFVSSRAWGLTQIDSTYILWLFLVNPCLISSTWKFITIFFYSTCMINQSILSYRTLHL